MTCIPSGENMFHSDLSGVANEMIEKLVGGVSLFVNGAAVNKYIKQGRCSARTRFIYNI
jgi:hypothetical protein